MLLDKIVNGFRSSYTGEIFREVFGVEEEEKKEKKKIRKKERERTEIINNDFSHKNCQRPGKNQVNFNNFFSFNFDLVSYLRTELDFVPQDFRLRKLKGILLNEHYDGSWENRLKNYQTERQIINSLDGDLTDKDKKYLQILDKGVEQFTTNSFS